MIGEMRDGVSTHNPIPAHTRRESFHISPAFPDPQLPAARAAFPSLYLGTSTSTPYLRLYL